MESAGVYEPLMPEVAAKACWIGDGSQVQRLPDREHGRHDGLVVQSALERVAVFTTHEDELTLADVSSLRRRMREAQARRALVCVPTNMSIPSPVMLLATLSKIEVIRLKPEA